MSEINKKRRRRYFCSICAFFDPNRASQSDMSKHRKTNIHKANCVRYKELHPSVFDENTNENSVDGEYKFILILNF